jgi:proline dehydrogenase
MVGLADENGKEYECKYGTYSKKGGFKFNEKINPLLDDIGWRGIVNKLFHDDLWKLKQDPIEKMTLEEIEEILGRKIQIIDSKSKKKEIDENHRKRVDDTIDFFRDILGIDLDAEDYY